MVVMNVMDRWIKYAWMDIMEKIMSYYDCFYI